VNDIIDTLNSFAEALENLRQDLLATVKDCQQLSEELEQLREATEQ
jgi:ABC-type transporter Mla subunit MlaD